MKIKNRKIKTSHISSYSLIIELNFVGAIKIYIIKIKI